MPDSSNLQYYADASEHSYCVREPEDDGWDCGDYALNLSFNGIYRTPKEGWYVTPVDMYNAEGRFDDIPIGKVAYVVVVEYTTGSTFGSQGTWTTWAVKRDHEDAQKLCDDCYKENPGTWGMYRPWDGYFESINSAYVEPCVMG